MQLFSHNKFLLSVKKNGHIYDIDPLTHLGCLFLNENNCSVTLLGCTPVAVNVCTWLDKPSSSFLSGNW